MKKHFKIAMIIFFIGFISLGVFTNDVKANSAEPAMIWILIPGSHPDLQGELTVNGKTISAYKSSSSIETYLRFFRHDLREIDPSYEPYHPVDATLTITTKNETYTADLSLHVVGYNQMFTYNLQTQTLSEGKTLMRDASLIGLRVFLTLLIEGIIFFLFGYRAKRTWIAFLIINLITQGVLNFVLNAQTPIGSYALLMLIFYEVIILIVEWLAFIFAADEPKGKLILTVFVANMASLVLGGFLISWLPL